LTFEFVTLIKFAHRPLQVILGFLPGAGILDLLDLLLCILHVTRAVGMCSNGQAQGHAESNRQ
jgi:hypothetical protein